MNQAWVYFWTSLDQNGLHRGPKDSQRLAKKGPNTQNRIFWNQMWFLRAPNSLLGSVNHFLLNGINQRYILDKILSKLSSKCRKRADNGPKRGQKTKSPILTPYLIYKFPKLIFLIVKTVFYLTELNMSISWTALLRHLKANILNILSNLYLWLISLSRKWFISSSYAI